MRQFDVYPNPSPRSAEAAPFIVVLQSHLLNGMPAAVVAPMLIDDGRSAYTEASVVLQFKDSNLVVSVAELATIEIRHLQRVAGSLLAHEDAIRRALDRVFTGF